jgi:peroxiredoxin
MRRLHTRYLPWAILIVFGGCVTTLWAMGALGTVRPAATIPARESGDGASGKPDHALEKHYVTPRQLAEVNVVVNQTVTLGQATDPEGRSLGWDKLSGGQPVVLVFLKEGCPCNVDFEPFFQRVERLYRGAVRFAGVIDAGPDAARRYARQQQVPYPVLADPGRDVIRRCRAENGGYVVLLSPSGAIDGAWPGCSADTLRALGRRIARLAGLEERPLDVNGMSDALLTGCPFAVR